MLAENLRQPNMMTLLRLQIYAFRSLSDVIMLAYLQPINIFVTSPS